MPCVCLANTFARWQSLREQRQARKVVDKIQNPSSVPVGHVVSATTPVPAAMMVPIAKGGTVAESTLRVPHSRKTHRKNAKVESQPEVTFGRPSVRVTRADLINAESKLGSTIFGPIPAGHRREFFHDKQNIWIWHEDWQDDRRNHHQMTVRYEVRTSGIYKKVSTGKYFKLEGEELENFRKATHVYLYVIKKNLYNKQRKPAKVA